ncbi:SpoIID/LytB domain-containing protein [Metabacillus sp. B2-18]|uniref:SpoIID/LytB domain-containing protein n=1 Tax=Metabacillus sp. B2-18 TaxID=2897333 RepID=UPI001E4922B5|nr:SpoIID/LytB domain-containing protein [Metabacillus sp. B2-18]UGB30459.1 SpoIID/LytB domain-containing protein [Metabacillus sp. B2-18]
MAKKVLLGVFLTLSLLWNADAANAASIKTYSNPVAVQLVDISTSTLKLQSIYELTNKANNQKTYFLPGLNITITRSQSNVNIDAGSASFSSASGFELKEVYNVAQYARFTTTTDLKSGATSDYPTRKSLTKAETAEYIGSFVNNKGETWFNVQVADGTKGWVPAKTTLIDKNTVSLPTIAYGASAYRGGMSLLPKTAGKVAIVNNLDLEDYLKGVVPNEMPASWHKEALKAQAIVARSYAANSMSLKNTTASQVYKGYTSEDARTNQAVSETAGVVVKYGGKPIQTFFYSTSGGRTANVGDVWNSNQASFPYLISVDDPYENSPHSNWQNSFTSSMILNSFGLDPATTTLYDIKTNPTGANGEITSVTISTSAGEKTVTGNELTIRKLFPIEGSYGFLKSNWFTLNVDKEYTVQTASGQQSQLSVSGQQVMTGTNTTSTISSSDVSIQTASGTITKEADPASITATGKGWGHRIGMSQYGAKGFAENNWKAVDIVKHYFPNTDVSK